jgi:hypothetical protein
MRHALGFMLLTACSTSVPPAREPENISSSLDAAIEETVRAHDDQRVVSRRMSTPKSMEVKRIGEPPRSLPPLGRRTRVDVHFRDADLGDALRFLAEAGEFALIADGKLPGKVNADMRRVVPYDAVVALAEAHGANVERSGRILVVRPK